MKDDMRIIAEKAKSMRIHNELLQKEHLQKKLKVYYLQREKMNIAKVNEKVKYLNILRQTLPVI